MNILIGITDSEELVENINKFIELSNQIGQPNKLANDLFNKINHVESKITNLLTSELQNYFLLDNATYEELDEKFKNSKIRGEIFCSANNKGQLKKLYEEVSKTLSSRHNVSKVIKELYDQMKENQFYICWNLGEEEANEILQNY